MTATPLPDPPLPEESDPVAEDPMPEDDAGIDDDALPEEETLADRFGHSGLGTEDPNIVGDVGPFDVAPGSDGDADVLYPDATGVDHVEL